MKKTDAKIWLRALGHTFKKCLIGEEALKPTSFQKARLLGLGFDPETVPTRADADRVIEMAQARVNAGLATPAQLVSLSKGTYAKKNQIATMTKEEVNKIFDRYVAKKERERFKLHRVKVVWIDRYSRSHELFVCKEAAENIASKIDAEKIEVEPYEGIYWKVDTKEPRYFADHASALKVANETGADIHKFSM